MEHFKILAVEDDAITAFDIECKLRRRGYRFVHRVSTGEEAIKKAGEIFPDVIIMDIRLGGEIDGLRAAEMIRDELNIPIIYLTGCLGEDDQVQTQRMASCHCLLKPFNDADLISLIETVLHN